MESISYSEEIEFRTQIPIEIYSYHQVIEETTNDTLAIYLNINAPNETIEGYVKNSIGETSSFTNIKNLKDDSEYILYISGLNDWEEYSVYINIYGNSTYLKKTNEPLEGLYKTDKFEDFLLSSNIKTLPIDNFLEYTLNNNHNYTYEYELDVVYKNPEDILNEKENVETIEKKILTSSFDSSKGYYNKLSSDVIYAKENWYNIYGVEEMKYKIKVSTEGLTTKEKTFYLKLDDSDLEITNVIDNYPIISGCFFNSDGFLTFTLKQKNNINKTLINTYTNDQIILNPKMYRAQNDIYTGTYNIEANPMVSLNAKRIFYKEEIEITFEIKEENLNNETYKFVIFDPLGISKSYSMVYNYMLKRHYIFISNQKTIKEVLCKKYNFKEINYNEKESVWQHPSDKLKVVNSSNFLDSEKEIAYENFEIENKKIIFTERPKNGILDFWFKVINKYYSYIGPINEQLKICIGYNELILNLDATLLFLEINSTISKERISEKKSKLKIGDNVFFIPLLDREKQHLRIYNKDPITDILINLYNEFDTIHIEGKDGIQYIEKKEESLEITPTKKNLPVYNLTANNSTVTSANLKDELVLFLREEVYDINGDFKEIIFKLENKDNQININKYLIPQEGINERINNGKIIFYSTDFKINETKNQNGYSFTIKEKEIKEEMELKIISELIFNNKIEEIEQDF